MLALPVVATWIFILDAWKIKYDFRFVIVEVSFLFVNELHVSTYDDFCDTSIHRRYAFDPGSYPMNVNLALVSSFFRFISGMSAYAIQSNTCMWLKSGILPSQSSNGVLADALIGNRFSR